MKEKIKEFSKSYLVGLILGIIVSGTIGVIAATYFPSGDVTYDNTVSGLQSTNVQGAIDELYTECTTTPAGDQIIEDGGLEKDPYECRYFFTGANPNNYITFNEEKDGKAGWRIISVECDGTIKIMRIASIGNRAWDTSNSNNWSSPASLNTYLNETYLNSLSSETQSQIVAYDFSIGAVGNANYNHLADQVNAENSKTWNGKIALPTVSEYLRTNSNSNCKTISTYNSNYNTCKNTTWMFNNGNWWTLSAATYGLGLAFPVNSFGYLNGDNSLVTYSYGVRPALYLSSNIELSGSGTWSDPYIIK